MYVYIIQENIKKDFKKNVTWKYDKGKSQCPY